MSRTNDDKPHPTQEDDRREGISPTYDEGVEEDEADDQADDENDPRENSDGVITK